MLGALAIGERLTLVPTTPEARRSAIQRGLEDIAPVIIEAYQKRDWEHFGFDSWSSYLADFGQLRLPRVERQAAALEMRQEGMSQRAISDALGVSHPTVHADLQLVDSDQLPDTITGLDGKTRPAKPHVSKNSGQNEWYTPPHVVQAVHQVMGAIDLDPASSLQANGTVGAESIFTIEDNGLHHPWSGRVFLNPPYSSDLVQKFTAKLCDEYRADRVDEACLLINNATETQAFQKTMRVANAVCFFEGRLSYWHPDRSSKTPLQGQAMLYFGGNVSRFRDVLRRLGIVLR